MSETIGGRARMDTGIIPKGVDFDLARQRNRLIEDWRNGIRGLSPNRERICK